MHTVSSNFFSILFSKLLMDFIKYFNFHPTFICHIFFNKLSSLLICILVRYHLGPKVGPELWALEPKNFQQWAHFLVHGGPTTYHPGPIPINFMILYLLQTVLSLLILFINALQNWIIPKPSTYQ